MIHASEENGAESLQGWGRPPQSPPYVILPGLPASIAAIWQTREAGNSRSRYFRFAWTAISLFLFTR